MKTRHGRSFSMAVIVAATLAHFVSRVTGADSLILHIQASNAATTQRSLVDIGYSHPPKRLQRQPTLNPTIAFSPIHIGVQGSRERGLSHTLVGSLTSGTGLRVGLWRVSRSGVISEILQASTSIGLDDQFDIPTDDLSDEGGEVRIQVPPGWGGPGEGRVVGGDGLRGSLWLDTDLDGEPDRRVAGADLDADGRFALPFAQFAGLPGEVRVQLPPGWGGPGEGK